MRNLALALAISALAGCAHPQPLVDFQEFDPAAGVLWAEPGQAKAGDAAKKAHPILITDVTVIDGTGAEVKTKQDILIEKGLISQIAPTGEIIPPKGTERIKGTGATALPGLVDLFVFAGSGGGPLWKPGTQGEEQVIQASLYGGVTTVVAAGNAGKLAALRDRIKKGEAAGPQLFLAAPYITVKNGYPAELPKKDKRWWQFGPFAPAGDSVREIANPTDAKKKINELADSKEGFDIIPVIYDVTPAAFPKMSQDSLRTIIDRTHSRGRKAIVFTGMLEDVVHAVATKADGIVHGVYEETLDDEKAAKLAAVLSASGIPYIPVMVEFWGQGNSVAGMPYPAIALEKETVDAKVLAAFSDLPKKQTGMLFKYAQTVGPQLAFAAANLTKIAGWKSEAGDKVKLVATSGSAAPGLFPGAALHRELELMVKAGVPPLEAIAAATSRPARMIRDDPKFGTIAPGLRADILLVNGDVVADITQTQNIHTVICGGRVIDRIALGQLAERQKSKEAAKPAKSDEKAPADAPPKKKKKSGADEDPEPM